MIFFTKHVCDPEAGDLQFYFNQKNLGKVSQYNVSVVDCQAETYHFVMQESKKGWKIIYPSKLPGWIYNYETSLSDIIIENIMIRHNQPAS